MTTLRTAIAWCCRLEVPWTADDVAAMAGVAPAAARAALGLLLGQGVVRRVAGGFAAGDRQRLREWARRKPTRGAQPGAGGNSRAYKQARAARERLLTAEGQARQAGRLTSEKGADLGEWGEPRNREQSLPSEPTVSLGVAAKSLGYHPDTLRSWEEKGLIRMSRSPTGHRRVPESELARLLDASGVKKTTTKGT